MAKKKDKKAKFFHIFPNKDKKIRGHEDKIRADKNNRT